MTLASTINKKSCHIRGYAESCTEKGVVGWLFDGASPQYPVRVVIRAAGHRLGMAVTDIDRPDVRASCGFSLPCGFHFRWEEADLPEALAAYAPGTEVSVTCHREGTDESLPSQFDKIQVEALNRWIENAAAAAITAIKEEQLFSPARLKDLFTSFPGQQVKPLSESGDARIIAFYLPQYHPIPENDLWWGPGFTEWTNVTLAKPMFPKHAQPVLPSELGFYDLRIPEVREKQAALAREYGIHGFCYYYYWFAGRRILERPLEEVLVSGAPDFPFCICWANENWSRRWDGSEHEILLAQEHNKKTDAAFINDVIPILKDPRYIRVGNAPLLIIYRISLLPEPRETAALWREICRENDIPEIHLCMAETFGLKDPYMYGFDSSLEFPPHGVSAECVNEKVKKLDKSYGGQIYSYEDVVINILSKDKPLYCRYPGVMTSWDNTPRRGKMGNIFDGATPELYEVWLRHALDLARDELPEGQRLVFINAWNEWAEGAHLEPDHINGRAYLEATRSAITSATDLERLLEATDNTPSLVGAAKKSLISQVRRRLMALELSNQSLRRLLYNAEYPRTIAVMKPGVPPSVQGLKVHQRGQIKIEQIGGVYDPVSCISQESTQKMFIRGWTFSSENSVSKVTPTYLLLQDTQDNRVLYNGFLPMRQPRRDVSDHFADIPEDKSLYSGLSANFDVSRVQPGIYRVGIMTRTGENVDVTFSNVEIEIA